MPNWTSNTIRAEGCAADLRAFLETVKWQDEIFDFNRLIPMPELLRHTGTGGCTIDGQQVQDWYIKDPSDAGGVRLFTDAEEAELKEIGHRSWYDWSVENWGTKWNACHTEIAENCIDEGYIEIRFDTAWSAPMPIFHEMFEMFPRLSFTCFWQDECEPGIYTIEREATEEPSEPQEKTTGLEKRGQADRGEWAGAALRQFQCASGADHEDALSDLLCDLMYWSDRNNFDFEAALIRARGHYTAETSETAA